jgi:hypothetical protein
MTITLQDPTDLDTGTSEWVRPTEPGISPIAPNERQLSVEVQSPGGHLRTITGTIAYFDEEAQTYMVHGLDGALIRVPVRAITKTFALPQLVA